MDTIISFNKLSHKLQKEIQVFHDEKIRNGNANSLSISTKEWFNLNFESWLVANGYTVNDENQRRFTRIEIEIPLQVSQTLIDNDESDSFDIVGKIINISRGGLFFKSPNTFNISSIIRVLIRLSDIEKRLTNVEALAMVTRCVKYEDNDYGVGVTFSSIYNDSMDNLSTFIFKHLVYYIQLED